MSLSLGSTGIGSLYLGSTKIAEAYIGSTKVYSSTPVDPYNPLGLPPYTIRLQYTDEITPTFSKGTGTQVSASPNVWDVTYNDSDWERLLYNHSQLLEVLGANTTGIASMKEMFRGCSSLTSVSLCNTSSVTNMQAMFYGCSSLETVPLFNTSSVTDMPNMFNNCSSLETVPLFNTSSVTSMYNMFLGCSSLTSVPLFDTSSVTSMSAMFRGCSSLTSVPLFNTSSVTRMLEMFLGCSSLTSVPLFNTSSVTDMTNMLRDCNSLTSVPLFNTSSVTNMAYMLGGCTHIAQSGYDLYSAAYSSASSKTASFSHVGAFTDCGSLSGTSRLSSIYVTWGGTKNGTTVSASVKSAKQLWTISSTGTSTWGEDKPLYLYGPNPFENNLPILAKTSITWTGTAKTGSFLVYPAIIQFNSGYSGALSFIRRSDNYILSYPSSGNTPSEIKLEITTSRYPITAGTYSSSKPLYFAYVAYTSLSNYGLQWCTNFNVTPTLYWTY